MPETSDKFEPSLPVPQRAACVQGPSAPLAVLSYASPFDTELGVWRSGKYVVLNQSSHLPPRCVVCNGGATTSVILHTGQLQPPLHVGLCGWHKFRWRFCYIVALLLTVPALLCSLLCVAASVGIAARADLPPFDSGLLIGGGLLAGATIVFLPVHFVSLWLKPLGNIKRKGNSLWLSRSGRAFRNSLRELEAESVLSPSEERT